MDVLYDKIIQGKFSVPGFISPQGKDLLKRILVTDPNKRITIKEIKKHPWFGVNTTTINQGIVISNSIIPVSYDLIIRLMEK